MKNYYSGDKLIKKIALCNSIYELIKEKFLTYSIAAAALGITYQKISDIKYCRVNFSLEHLNEILGKLKNYYS